VVRRSLGSGSVPIYDGMFDVALEEDVIIATINYRCAVRARSYPCLLCLALTFFRASHIRLEVFGFLSGQPLIDESADGSVGNYGFQDQRAAMEFLHDTATAFSG